MIDEIFNKPHVQRRLRHGPLATTFAAYVDHLQGRGYGQFTIQQYVQAVEHFEAWMTRRGNVVADVKPGLVMKFLVRHLPRCRCRQLRQRAVPTARAALRQLLIVGTSSVEHGLREGPVGRDASDAGEAHTFAEGPRGSRYLAALRVSWR